MQAEYWRRRVSTENKIAYVQYGNDVEGTAFCDHGSEDPLGRTDWNMRVRRKCCCHISAGQPTCIPCHTFYRVAIWDVQKKRACCTDHLAVLLRPLSCPGPAQAAQLDAGPAGGGDPRRVHPHALHRHGLRHLCMACGGPLPVLNQLPAPGRCQDLVHSCAFLCWSYSVPVGFKDSMHWRLPCFTTSISAGTLQICRTTSSLAMSLLSLSAMCLKWCYR